MSTPGPTRPASLRQVAKQAGVSVMTASRALRNAGHCSERTRRRVLAKAKELGYRPDAKVGSLRSSSMGVFQIVGKNSNEDYSWGGTFNTDKKEKVASITVKAVYDAD